MTRAIACARGGSTTLAVFFEPAAFADFCEEYTAETEARRRNRLLIADCFIVTCVEGRNMASRIFASWNRVQEWLRRLEALRTAA